ncbi:MAG: asparagine--tRNA ligase [Clostridiales bacterium]|jgi:asparaginyl-tRNA synthetase|nr:asparagine--tRNA ligase [Clostridiales bacterium]
MQSNIDIGKVLLNPKKFVGKDIEVCGWVKTSRESKNIAFIEINDGSSLKHLQIVIDKSLITQNTKFMQLCTALRIVGSCVMGQNSNLPEINAKNIEVLGECPLDYPIQKKPHSLEFLREHPHLRMRTNTFNAMFRLRSILSEAIHKYFWENDFLYVHTPIIVGTDCEGAGSSFYVTTHGYSHGCNTEQEYCQSDFFGTSAYLTVSGQLEGEAYALALGKVYTFGPTFRAENSNTTRHVAEFWMIEPEVAFADIEDIMEICTQMVKYIVQFVLDKAKSEIEFFEKFYEKGLVAKLQSVVQNEFIRLDYKDAVKILLDSKKNFEYPIKWGLDLQTEHEKFLADQVYKKPVFIVNYPKDLKAFYMKQNEDNLTVAATDLLFPGIGEIIGCSERETDFAKLLNAVESRNMKLADYKNYLELRKFGSAPHSGFGLGLERMLMYISGISNIRDTQGYPRAKFELRV